MQVNNLKLRARLDPQNASTQPFQILGNTAENSWTHLTLSSVFPPPHDLLDLTFHSSQAVSTLHHCLPHEISA